MCGVLTFLVVWRFDLSNNLFSSLGGRPSFAICDSPCLIIVSNEDSFSSVALSIESLRTKLFPLDLAFLEYFFSLCYIISGLFDERGDFLRFFIEPGFPRLWELDLLLLCSVLRRCCSNVANVFTWSFACGGYLYLLKDPIEDRVRLEFETLYFPSKASCDLFYLFSLLVLALINRVPNFVLAYRGYIFGNRKSGWIVSEVCSRI